LHTFVTVIQEQTRGKNKIFKNDKNSFTHEQQAHDTMILNLFKKRYQRAKKNPNIGSEDLSKMEIERKEHILHIYKNRNKLKNDQAYIHDT
jgi:hypothetical protein